MTVSSRIQSSFVAVVVLACGQPVTNGPQLRVGAAALCDPTQPLLVWLRDGRRLALNSAPLDSAALAQWITDELPKRPSSGKVVMIRVDSAQSPQLNWLVPLIEKNGGLAYRPDSMCVIPVPEHQRRASL